MNIFRFRRGQTSDPLRYDSASGLFIPGSVLGEIVALFRASDSARDREARYERELENQARRQRSGYFDPARTPLIQGGAVSAAYSVVGGTAFSAATGAKTALDSISPAGHGLALTEFAVSTDGVTSSAVPAVLDVCQSTQGAAGTSGVAPTITQVRGRTTGGSPPTGGSNYSAEPTTLTVIKKFYLPQLMGTFIYQSPLGREVECDSSGGTVKALAIRINSSATVNVLSYAEVEAVG